MSIPRGDRNILGIETSCDETSAALLVDGRVVSNVISSQLIHSAYGGVVPELAARAHQRLIIQVVGEALARGGITKEEIDGIAATQGPGLVGALLVGLSFGKALAFGLGIPFTAVNHMEGHLYSVFLEATVPGYPFLALIVSGGHTMLVHVEAPFRHTLLGETRDDAAGEAFDKVAKMLGLGYPGGAAIDALAAEGDPRAIPFPRSFPGDQTLDFSFSGIKTSVLYYLRREGLGELGAARTMIDRKRLADICASFQAAVVDVLVTRTMDAVLRTGVRDIALAGGVSANSSLRRILKAEAGRHGFRLFTPRLEYCMDNGAMIGYVGWMRFVRGLTSPFEAPALARLEIEEAAL
jgi:N6-L-threonylcarbamoyladenine synthase